MSRLNPPTSAADSFFSIAETRHRHLVWSLLGPSLMQTDWAPATPDWLPSLTELLETPVPTAARSARLGLVFEHLWHHWLAHTDWRWQANLQIMDAKRTLGEMDLLLQPKQPTVLHLELALKFYAGHDRDWIGPNRRDYLADKLHHTQTRQLALSANEQARQQLKEHGWGNSISDALAVLRGCLFHPAHPNIEAQLPAGISPQHWRGRWCHYSHLRTCLPHARWYLLSKDEWISPVLSQLSIANSELYTLLDLHFRYLSTPVCLARVESGPYGWGEIERWFVMPDHWPSKPVTPTAL